MPKIAIITSRFNPEVTDGLKWGAIACLNEAGVSANNIYEFSAPGAFELPLLAQTAIEQLNVDAVICLGCVIKGDTAHFEFISLGSTVGIQQVSLAKKAPVSFGILTTYTDEQAQARSKKDAHNKGREAALAVLESLTTIQQMKTLQK